MRTKRRLRAGIALAAVAGLTLTGCSSADDGGSTADGIEITFHSWLPTQVQWPELIAAFEKENPGITVNFTREEDFDTYKTNLDNEILAGETPDIYGVQVGTSFDDYADYALPVDEYASEWIDQVNAQSLDQTTTSDGTLAAVPILNAGMEYYLYNETLWDELGLTLPETYDDVVDVSAKARESGYSPFAMGAADGWHDNDFFVWMSNQFGSGGDIYKAAAGDIPWDSDSLVEAATAWQGLFTDGVFQDAATTTTTYPSARDDFFLTRKAIAMPTGSWHVGMSLEGPDQEQPGSAIEDDEVGMAPFPPIGPNDAGATSGVDFAMAVSVDSDPEQQEAAAKFVEFMAVGAGQQLWVNTLQGFPVAEGVDIEVADDEPQIGKDSVKLVTDSLGGAQYPRKLSSPDNSALENDLGVVLQNIAGGADPKTELATLNE
jgi:raffinose/stachyose/melibiose transport system substrate-binding protein